MRPPRRKSGFDPNVWSGRALQEAFVDPGKITVLHQCIRPLLGACAPGHHGYQRACDVITGQASPSRLGHQCSHAPGRPISILVSSSRRPRRAKGAVGYIIDSSPYFCSFVRAWRPFLRPDLRVQRCAARRDCQGWPSHVPCLSRQRGQATPCMGPSTARGLSGLGCGFIGLDALEGAPLVKNRPGDAGELVGERDRQHVVV